MEALRILSRQIMAQVILGKNLQDLKTALKTRDDLEQDMQDLILDLQEAKSKIQTLQTLLPVCAWCKKVRDDQGYWGQVEAYITKSTGVATTGSICPGCLGKISKDPLGADKMPD